MTHPAWYSVEEGLTDLDGGEGEDQSGHLGQLLHPVNRQVPARNPSLNWEAIFMHVLNSFSKSLDTVMYIQLDAISNQITNLDQTLKTKEIRILG